MSRPLTCGALLLATTFTARVTIAQEATDAAAPATNETDEAYAAASSSLDVVLPGIVVVGTRDGNVQRAAAEVVSILSNEDIARTGEGDIAGALARVPGLSVAGGGFVYVRGLGDRYSQALLNGLPLPSPEPLRRSVPLDLFPTDVIASSLVQKTYSPNLPGEFGGGIINLTTLAAPMTPFLKFGAGASYDTETTGQPGYDHYGNSTDWTGYDNGAREVPPALSAFLASGQRMSAGNVDTGEIAKEFVSVNNGLVQKVDEMPVNYSASVSGGTSWALGDSVLGIIATAGYGNKWRTRDNIEQTPGSADLSVVDKDYRTVASDNRVIANALLGVGYELPGGSKFRWTSLYVHDTLKHTALSAGEQNGQQPGTDFLEQSTAWYERELFSTQLTGGVQFDTLALNGRVSYSMSSRESPYELDLGYVRTNRSASPYGAYFINRLDNGQSGFGKIAFSDLDEDQLSAGADLGWQFLPGMNLSVGYDITDTERDSSRREFQIVAPSTFPNVVAMLRPDYLLGSDVIDYYGITLIETTESAPAFTASLLTRAGYTQLQAELGAGFDISAGVRFESGLQEVSPLQVFNSSNSNGLKASTKLDNDYWLPAVTLTWKLMGDMQIRANASRTIARPQFRELMFQSYYDPEANRTYVGNPLLVDSEFTNAELRYEWYFAAEQRISLAAFYKEIDKPIESFTGFNDNTPITSFANAPRAKLFGAEAELQKYFPLDGSSTDFFAARRIVLIGNYTYSNSRINVTGDDMVQYFGTATQPAKNFFVDGSPLTGQSDHLVNLQIGLENTGRLSQQTLLVSYASDRVTSRGPAGLPDIYESPGVTLDFVAREGFKMFGTDTELKLEARNITGHGYQEYQERDGNTIYYNKYDVGTVYAVSIDIRF